MLSDLYREGRGKQELGRRAWRWPIRSIGRDEELNAVRAFGDSKGPAVVMLEGDADIGKTTVWEAVIAAEGPGRQVLRARPAEAEMALSFAGLSDLLGGVLEEALVDLPPPQRHALEVALLLEPGEDRSAEHRAVAAGFRGALCALAETDRLLVAIDDVQWLDRSSAAALAFTLRRLEGAGVDFLLTERIEAGVPRALGLDRPPPELEVERVRIEPLSAAAVQRLLHIHLGDLSSSCIAPHPRHVGGNPFFALELARALGRAEPPAPGEPLPVPDTPTSWSSSASQAYRERRRRPCLPPLLGQPSLSRLEAAVGRHAADALQPAVAAHVARLEHDRVQFAHPLLASGIVEATDARTRRALHRRIAEVAEQPEERARHLALASEGPDESVAAALAAAAATVAAAERPRRRPSSRSERAA